MITEISIAGKKKEPAWMREFRLRSLEIYNSKPMPQWGPDLSDLDVNEIITYIDPGFQETEQAGMRYRKRLKRFLLRVLGIPKEQESLGRGRGPVRFLKLSIRIRRG